MHIIISKMESRVFLEGSSETGWLEPYKKPKVAWSALAMSRWLSGGRGLCAFRRLPECTWMLHWPDRHFNRAGAFLRSCILVAGVEFPTRLWANFWRRRHRSLTSKIGWNVVITNLWVDRLTGTQLDSWMKLELFRNWRLNWTSVRCVDLRRLFIRSGLPTCLAFFFLFSEYVLPCLCFWIERIRSRSSGLHLFMEAPVSQQINLWMKHVKQPQHLKNLLLFIIFMVTPFLF